MGDSRISLKASSAARARYWVGLPANLRGALWMVGAATGFTVSASLIKTLTATGIDPFQTVFARAVIGLVAILPFMYAAGPAALRTSHPWIHIVRGICGAVAMLCGYTAISLMPLAEVTALTFTQPLFTLVLAVVLLGEVVRWRRWTATAIGFLGVLVMVRPGVGTFQPEALLALASALGIAIAVILVKRLPTNERQATTLFFFGIVTVLITVGPAVTVWQMPSLYQAGLLLAVGIIGVSAQAMIIQAYRVGQAAYVAPFDYSKLILATILGYFVFEELPGPWTLAGALLIAASTFYISRREARYGRLSRDTGEAAPS